MKSRRKRHQYTEEQRSNILTAARKDALTALQVQRKFGVTPVTYYSWRKKTGLTRRRGGPIGTAAGSSLLLGRHVRGEVRAKVRQILPGIVRSEVSGYLQSLFGNRRGRPR